MRLNRIIFFFLFFVVIDCQAQNDIVIPNIITPNNDNINDSFTIRAVGYANLSCTIFNRYGETVYRFYGINGSWDGYTHAGVKVSAGTYFVFVELLAEDGAVETRQGTLQVTY